MVICLNVWPGRDRGLTVSETFLLARALLAI